MSQSILQTISIRNEGGPIVNFTLTEIGAVKSEATLSQSNDNENLNDDTVEECEDYVQKHKCNNCFKVFKQFSVLKTHWDLCHLNNDYHLRTTHMMKKIKKIENDGVSIENDSICFYCGESYNTSHKGHINCSYCTKSFKTQMGYERHIFVIHSKAEEFPCPASNAKLRSADLLRLHKEQHESREGSNACKKCRKKLKHKFNLIHHQKYTSCQKSNNDTIHSETFDKNVCHINSLQELLNHHMNKKVTKNEEFTCPICRKCFLNLSILTWHKRTHIRERLFACAFYRKKFRRLDALKGQYRSHTTEKPCKCTGCNHGFSLKSFRNRHMIRHTAKCTSTRLKDIKKRRIDYAVYNEKLGSAKALNSQIFGIHKDIFHNGNSDPSLKLNSFNENTIENDTTANKNFILIEKSEEHTSKETDVIEQQYIPHKVAEATKNKLLENGLNATLENDRHKMEQKFTFVESLDGVITNDQTSIQDVFVQQFIKDEIPETTTEKFLLETEKYTTMVIENETIKTVTENIAPVCVIGVLTNKPNSFDSSVDVPHFLKEELTETNTRQLLLENKMYAMLENRFLKTNAKADVLETPNDDNTDCSANIEDDVQQFEKDKTSKKATQQLLIANKESAIITFENETIKTESTTACKSLANAITNDKVSFKDGSTAPESLTDKVTETSTKQLLLENELTVSKVHKKIDTEERPFACDFCEKKFPYLSTLTNHRRSHTGEKPYQCSECCQSFSVKESLNRHMRQHTGEKPFTCDECNQSFSLKSSLSRHMKSHTGVKPYKCTECNQSFTSKQSLSHHIKRHTGEKPYTCSECNQSFARKQVLNHHKRRHTGEKPHVCNECGLSFFEATRLRYHSKIHLRPFACDQCEEKFKTIKQLEQHIRIHSSITVEKDALQQKFKCKECNGTYTTEEELDNHYDMGIHIHIEKGRKLCTVRNNEFGSVKTKVHKKQQFYINNTECALKSDGASKDSQQTLTEAGRIEKQCIIDEVAEAATKNSLLEKDMCNILQCKNIKLEPKDTDDLIPTENAFVVHKFIKKEKFETSTDLLLLENEIYSEITLENETIKMESKNVVS